MYPAKVVISKPERVGSFEILPFLATGKGRSPHPGAQERNRTESYCSTLGKGEGHSKGVILIPLLLLVLLASRRLFFRKYVLYARIRMADELLTSICWHRLNW